MSDRPHCLNREACASTGPRHCGRCAAVAKYADPAQREAMSRAKRVALQDPEKRRRVIAAGTRNLLAGREGVDYSALQRAHVETLSDEQRRAKYARLGHMRGLSGRDLHLYKILKRKGYRAADAREMVLEEARRAVTKAANDMKAREQRRKAQAY